MGYSLYNASMDERSVCFNMIKMFTTQVTGLMNYIKNKQSDPLEDAARLLSQALIGDGFVYIYGKDEMEAIEAEALAGKERIQKIRPLITNEKMATLHPVDRVLLVTRFANDRTVINYANELIENNIPFVVISSIQNETDPLVNLADVHINLHVTRKLIPTDDGTRLGFPASLLALYTYFCLHFLMTDIMADYSM